MASVALWQAAFLLSLGWAAWRLFKAYISKSPLDIVPGPPSPSWLAGNIPQLVDREKGWDYHRMLGETYGSVFRFSGFFGSRALYIFDPVALHSIVIKNQDIYERSDFALAVNQLMLGPSLIGTTGDQHRAQRKSLTPVFSIAHMRYLTPIFYETMHRLRTAVAQQVGGAVQEVDILDWMGRAALELIGQGGLGYSFDSFVEDMKDGYGRAMKELQPAISSAMSLLFLAPYHRYLGPTWFKRLLADYAPNPHLRILKQLSDTMDAHSRSIFRAKKEALFRGDEAVSEQVGRGKDIMSILLKSNTEANEEERLPEEEVLAQISTFVFAATDTTSNALARILHLLAIHQDVQDKLRAEVQEARNGQDIPYDQLVDLPYLDAVCRETLRLYPPVPLTGRQATQDMILPLSQPIQGLDGTFRKEILVPKGTLIFISNWLSNINKELWGEDAYQWKPERWLSPPPEALKDARIPGVYSNLMTFLGGSRACIGFKFSQLEMKVALSILVDAFKFRLTDQPVYWTFGNITFPTMKEYGEKPSLILKVEALHKVATKSTDQKIW